MARKRTSPPAPASPEPDPLVTASPEAAAAAPEAAAPEAIAPKVADMPLRDLLQMLGRTLPETSLPETSHLPPRPMPALPAGIDAEAKTRDLTVGALLELLAAFQSPQ